MKSNVFSKLLNSLVSANNLFIAWSTWAIFIILMIFGLCLTLDTFLSPKKVYYEDSETKIISKVNSTYNSHNGSVSTSRYYSSVLHLDSYSLLLADYKEISQVRGALRKGKVMFKITPVFGQVKSYVAELDKEVTSRNFVYTWWCYVASLFFIVLQLITKLRGKVFEYLFAYIAIFMTLYILFYI